LAFMIFCIAYYHVKILNLAEWTSINANVMAGSLNSSDETG